MTQEQIVDDVIDIKYLPQIIVTDTSHKYVHEYSSLGLALRCMLQILYEISTDSFNVEWSIYIYIYIYIYMHHVPVWFLVLKHFYINLLSFQLFHANEWL